MNPVSFAIARPITVAVGVILLVMFGLIGLGAIPIQLTPTVDRPLITVSTSWPGRSPQEIVDEITKEQESVLKNVEGLRKMVSMTRQGEAEISLEFTLATDIDRARQDVSDALRQVPEYPENVNEPVVIAANSGPENAIAWIILDLDDAGLQQHPDFDITTLFDIVDRDVKPHLERTAGVAQVNVYGGRPREVRVLVDPLAMAQRGLNHVDVMAALRAENQDISAGDIADGRRDYRVRLVGQFRSTDEVLSTIVAYRDTGVVRIRDIARVEVGHEKQRGFVRAFGQPSLAINVIRQTDTNVVQVMNDLRQRLDEIRADVLPELHPLVGPHLRLRQVYDETTYIESAVGLVTSNLWIGGLIAAAVLLIFLRSFVATGVIVLAIPVSVIGTFLVMLAMGRTINVISLAGLAFAVGMVVDNAIVVLENIYRRRQLGDGPRRAAQLGAQEVWGAVLASSLTTIAVFIPVLTIQEEAGQLFRDISLAIASAVALSMLVSVTVIPAATSRWLRPPPQRPSMVRRQVTGLFGLAEVSSAGVRAVGDFVHWVITGWRGWTIRPAIIVFLTAVSIVGALWLAPPMDYLPAGNRNLVFGGLLLPPGQSLDQQVSLAERIEARIRPYAEASRDPSLLGALPPIPSPEVPGGAFAPVAIDNFFIGAFRGGMFLGATSADDAKVRPLEPLLTGAMNSLSGDVFGGARQSSLFGRGASGGTSIDVEVAGPNLQRVTRAAGMMYFLAGSKYGFGVGVSATPGNFSISQPETRIAVTDVGRELGLSTGALSTALRGLFDGAFVGDFQLDGEPVDLVLLPLGGRLEHLEQVRSIPIATPAGPVVPVDTVMTLTPGLAPQEIQRIEELPAITISVTPPPGAPIEAVMNEIRAQIIEPTRAAGLLDSSMRVRLEGTAAKLDEVQAALFGAPGEGGGQAMGPPLIVLSWVLLAGSLLLALFVGVRAFRRGRPLLLYGAAGALLLGVSIGGASWVFGANPHFLTARFIWALVVTFLLMSALFESFVYPFVIMFTVPLAIVGGFLGLRIVHDITAANPYLRAQNLDTLTMLGFVILIGVVVNNAILIVHQALNFMRGAEEDPMPPMEAIAESVRTRIRPIFMSTLTSVGGMAPLVIMPGAGSEMYRGLGSVVLGGLLVSTIFTMVLTPLLFSLVIDMKLGLAAALQRSDAPAPQPVEKAPPIPARPAAAEREIVGV